jgi:hypothetical protein
VQVKVPEPFDAQIPLFWHGPELQGLVPVGDVAVGGGGGGGVGPAVCANAGAPMAMPSAIASVNFIIGDLPSMSKTEILAQCNHVGCRLRFGFDVFDVARSCNAKVIVL